MTGIGRPLMRCCGGILMLTGLLTCTTGPRIPLRTAALFPTLGPKSRCRVAEPPDKLARGHVVIVTIESVRTPRRIVAIGGDEVEVRGGVVYLNGTSRQTQLVRKRTNCHAGVSIRCRCRIHKEHIGDREYLVQALLPINELTDARCIGLPDMPRRRLEPESFFLMADNRDGAVDSRDLGPFARSQIHARVLACSKAR